MPRFLPVVALALLTASGAAAQICPAGATDLGDGVCLVVEDAQPSGTAPAGLSPADVVPFGIPRVRSADIDFDSTTVPYTVRLQELFATDPDSGRPSIRIAVVAEWTHLPGTPYYSMRAQADGTLFNPTNSSGLPVGAGETHYRARDSFPQDIVAAPGNLVFRNVLVVGVRGEGLDDEEWESLQAQTRARAATFRATWYGALAAFQPALTSEIQIAADSVSAGEPFDLDVVVTNPWGTRALDVKPTGELAFTDADGQPIGAVDILEEPLPIDTLAGGASGTLRYRVAVRSVGLASATVPIGATWTAYYREPVEARPICSFDGLRTSVASCAVEVSGTNIVVTVDGDDPDADDTDDICDASESEPGLQCTLRAALSVAEKEGGATIRFGIPGGGTPRIAIGGPLAVSVPVLIDGTSQLGKVEIDGSGAGAPFGLTLSGNGSDIRGVAFLRTALAVEGRRSTVAGNRFGSSWASGDTRESVLITSQAIDVSGAGSQIGVAGEPNEFVHVGVGIDIRADSVRVFANLIGDGGRQIGADLHGIVVRADTATIERNEILYTGQTGVLVVSSARRAALLGNVVRFGAGDGVRVEPGAGAVIGGGGIEEENRIEGNGGFGIVTSTASGRRVEDAGTGNLRIISNVTQRNASGGVLVRGVDGVQIGEPSERPGLGLGNTIRDGVRLLAASGTVLQGNLITDERDTPSWPLLVSGDGIQIGGPSAGDGNLIEGSSSVIEATLSTVLVEGQGAVIEGNTIKDGFTGLTLSGASARVLGNEITLNREYGIVVNGEGSVIGGARSDDACEGPCNLVTLNTAGGIQVTPAGVRAQILGNYVGVDNEGAFGNGHGILVSGADVQIGGPGGVLTGPCDGVCNVIGGNDGYGIVGGELNRAGFVDDSGPRGLVVQGNVIGTGAGSGAPNGIGGVLLGAGTEGAVIGAVVGEADGTRGNLILGNGAVGVRVTSRGGASWNNTIRVNEIVAGNTPIDLVPIGRGGVGDGSTPNDAGDGDEGPNRLLNWPTLVESRLLSSTQAELLVLWTGGNAGTEGTYRLDVYANASCRGWMADASVRVAGATL
ncbi:MAG: right-handed parallel beta-helix repeat-containing protein, partial [Bacteroidota bacterium]